MDDPSNLLIWILEILALIGFIILSAFFSGSETALFSLHKLQLKKMQQEERDKQAVKFVVKLLEDPQKTLITILTGNMFVNIAASSLATYLAISFFGDLGTSIAAGVMTFLILILGEIVPKSLAVTNAEKIAKRVAKPLNIFSSLTSPLVKFFKLIINLPFFSLPGKAAKRKAEVTEEDLITLIDVGKDEGIIEEEEIEMIRNVFEFGDTTVKEVMVPRVDMVCIPVNTKLETILSLISQVRHSKIPVYEETIDNIIGILYAKDLLTVYEQWYQGKDNFDLNLKKILRTAYFVPENKKIDELLDIFQRDRIQIAIAIDEYGGTAGLVTLEDVIEEIVGEIVDEYEKETKLYEVIDNHTIIADGIIDLDEINELFNLEIPKNDFETLGGFIYDLMGRVPKKGEKVEYQNLQIIIEQVVKNRIKRVRIIKKDWESTRIDKDDQN